MEAIIRPLGKIWVIVKKARTAADDDGPAEIWSSEEVALTVEKTVTVVRNVANILTNERSKDTLVAVAEYSTSQTATTLKDKSSFLQLRDIELFKINYWEQVLEVNKSMKNGNKIVLSDEAATAISAPSNRLTLWRLRKQPLLKGPRMHWGQYPRQNKDIYDKESFFSQQSSTNVITFYPELGDHVGSFSCSPYNKKIFSNFQIPDAPWQER